MEDEQKEATIRMLERFRDEPEDSYEYAINDSNSTIRMGKRPDPLKINTILERTSGQPQKDAPVQYNFALASLWKSIFETLPEQNSVNAHEALKASAISGFIPSTFLLGVV